jgi:putative transposase
MKKTYTPELKAKIVLELFKEEETVNRISSKYEVHPSLLNKWKKAVIEGMPEILADSRRRDVQIKEHEEETKKLYAQIGELSSKLNWLKKKSGIEPK